MAFNLFSFKKHSKNKFGKTSRFFAPEILPLETRINPADFTANLLLTGTPVANIVEVVMTSNGANDGANNVTFFNDSLSTITLDAGLDSSGNPNTININNLTSGNLSVSYLSGNKIAVIGLNSVQISDLKIVGSIGEDRFTIGDLNSSKALQTTASFGVEVDTATYSGGVSNDSLVINGTVNLRNKGSFITSNLSPEKNLASIRISSAGSINNNDGDGIIRLTANARIDSGITIDNGGVLKTTDGQIALLANTTANPKGNITLNGNAVESSNGTINFLSDVFLQTTSTVKNNSVGADINFYGNINAGGGNADISIISLGNINIAGNIGDPLSNQAIGNIFVSGPASSLTIQGDIVAASLQTTNDVNGNITIQGNQNYTSLQAINVTSAGTNYISAPTVTITGGGGANAVATASLSATGIQGTIIGVEGSLNGIVSIPTSGSGYNVGDTVTITGGSANATAQVVTVNATGGITSLGSLVAGSGYNILNSSPLSITGGSGNGAEVNVDYVLSSFTGSNYKVGDLLTLPGSTNPTTLVVTQVDGSGAIVDVGNLGKVNPNLPSIYDISNISNVSPTSSPNGTGAVLNLLGTVSTTSAGSGYAVGDVISFANGDPNNLATAVVTDVNPSGGKIENFTITNGGSGYASLNNLTVLGGSGTGAIMNLYGNVTRVTMNNYGSGYIAPPLVTFQGGGGSGVAAVGVINTNNLLDLATANQGNITLLGDINMAKDADINLDHSGTLTIGGYIEHGIFNQVGTTQTSNVQLGVDKPIRIYADGGITFNSPVLLVQDTLLKTSNSNGVEFNSTLDGARILSIETTGELIFRDNVGGINTVAGIQTTNQNPFKLTFNTAGKTLQVGQMTVTTTGDVDLSVDQIYTGSGLRLTTLGQVLSPGDIKLGKVTSNFGSVGSVNISNAGNLYLNGNLDLDGSFTQAALVSATTITNTGSGYTSSPIVTFNGGGASEQATATTTISPNRFVGVQNPGSGYKVGDILTIADGRSSGSPLATVRVDSLRSGTSGGMPFTNGINSLTVLTFGAGYTNLTNMTLTGGSGSAAVANFSGLVTDIQVTRRGSGYQSNPTITFSGGSGSGAAAAAFLTTTVPVFAGIVGGNPLTITTNSGDVTFVNPIQLRTDLSILTGQTGTADVTLGVLNSLAGNNFNLEVEAKGDIKLRGAIGVNDGVTPTPLGDINLAKAVATSVSATGSQIIARTLQAVATNNINITASQTYSGVISGTSNSLFLQNTFSGSTVNLGAIDTSAGTGGITVDNAGVLTLSGNIVSGAHFEQIGNGNVNLGLAGFPVSFSTNGQRFFINGDVELLSDLTVTSNGGPVTFENLIDGDFNITINARNTVFQTINSATVINPGSNYNLGDVVKILGGTSDAFATVTNALNGQILALAINNPQSNGGYTNLSNLALETISGNGSGATVSATGNLSSYGGNVTFADRLGFDPVGKIRIQDANSVIILGAVLAESMVIDGATGPIVVTGQATFIPPSATSTEKSLIINTTMISGSVVLQSNVDAPNGVEINNTGMLTLPSTGDLNISNGGFAQKGTGIVSIAGDIIVMKGDIDFTAPVLFSGNSKLSAQNTTNPAVITLTPTIVDTVNDKFTVNYGASFETGLPVTVTVSSGGSLPGGLVANKTYYLIRSSSTTIQFAATSADAISGKAVGISTVGSGALNIIAPLGTQTPVVYSSINFGPNSTVNGNGNAYLDSTGTITFGADIGNISPLGTLQINNSHKNALFGVCTDFRGNVSVDKMAIARSIGDVVFRGNTAIQSQFLTGADNYNLDFRGGTTVIGGQANFLNAGNVNMQGTTSLNGTGTFNNSGILNIQGTLNAQGSLSIQRPVQLTGGLEMFLAAPSNTISGSLIGGTAGNPNPFSVKSATSSQSTLIISKDSPAFFGNMKVLNGANLQISAALANAYATVDGGKISGNGQLLQIVGASGSVSPGSPLGTMTISNSLNMNYSTSGKFTSAINGASIGRFGQARVLAGTTTINNTSLEITQASNLLVGQKITLINNNVGVGLVGTFNGLPEGASFKVGNPTINTTFSISYSGGDGNDVVLTVTGVNTAPLPPSNSLNNSGVTKFFAVGADVGGGPVVSVNFTNGHNIMFYAYSPNYRGGVRVTIGDVNGDGYDDLVTGTGVGGGPHVKVWDLRGVALGGIPVEMSSFFSFEPNFMGGTNLATGDVNADGIADIIVGAGIGGGPRVKVLAGNPNFAINPAAPIMDLFAYNPAFTGGVQVAAGDRDGDGVADVITGAGIGGGPNIRSFNAASSMIDNFFAFSPTITTGIFIAAGNVDNDGLADIMAGTGYGTTTRVSAFFTTGFTGSTIPFTAGFIGGARPGVMLNPEGRQEFAVAAGPGGGPEVRVFNNSLASIDAFFVINPLFSGGSFLNTTL